MTDVLGATDRTHMPRGRSTRARSFARHPLALTGPLLLALPCIVAGILGFVIHAPHGSDAAIGMAAGAAAFVAMSETLILAARPRLLEPLFGGLDRMYRAHKWLGIFALVLMILHNTVEPDFERTVRETDMGELASEAGELAFNALLVLIGVSWFRRLPFTRLEIPYPLWRFSHRFMGVLFATIAFHQFFVDMPAGVDRSLFVLLNGFGVAGVAAWVVTELVAPRLRRREFTISRMARHGDTATVTLTPKGRPMRWQPGQFAFVSVPEAGLSEPHPFTIASAPEGDGHMIFAIRALGGWTRRLPLSLRKGMTVRVEGPYGRFDFRKGGGRQVWLAGGIGITPFLAWAESLSATEGRHIHLVHCVRTPDEAIGRETLQAAAARNPRFSFEVVVTSREGRLTAERLIRSAPFPVREADLWFCGPASLKQAVLRGLERLGQTPRRVRFEYFEFA